MKQIQILLLCFTLNSCIGQGKYFDPEGITDKTEQYVKDNKGWVSLLDKESVDGYTRIGNSIYGGEIACNIEPIDSIDINSFEVLPGTQYARDKNHIYYPLVIPCIDYSDCGVCYYGEVIIKNANPITFKYLGKDYAVDQQYAYFRGEQIKNANGATFSVIEGPEYFYFAVDSANVYRHNQIFKVADPATFYCDMEDKRTVVTEFHSKIIIGDSEREWLYTPPATIKEVKKN